MVMQVVTWEHMLGVCTEAWCYFLLLVAISYLLCWWDAPSWLLFLCKSLTLLLVLHGLYLLSGIASRSFCQLCFRIDSWRRRFQNCYLLLCWCLDQDLCHVFVRLELLSSGVVSLCPLNCRVVIYPRWVVILNKRAYDVVAFCFAANCCLERRRLIWENLLAFSC